MLIKMTKHPNASLFSDVDEKGKGKRNKMSNKRFLDSEKETFGSKRMKTTSVQRTISPLQKSSQGKENMPIVNATLPVAELTPSTSNVGPNPEGLTMSADVNSAQGVKFGTPLRKSCKLKEGTKHKCAYNKQGHVTMESLADAVCAMGSKLKLFD